MPLPYRPPVPGMDATDEAELAELLDLLQADDWPEDLFEGREFYDHWGTPVAADIEVSPCQAGGVAAWLLTPPDADATRIGLWLHGGGYVFGSQRSHGALVAEAARAAASRSCTPSTAGHPSTPTRRPWRTR